MREAAGSLADSRAVLASFAAGEHEQAVAAARDRVRLHPDDPVYGLVAGRLLLETGRPSEAGSLLEGAVADPALPDVLRRAGNLLAGQAADATGKRDAALEWYQITAEGPSFPGRDAAFLYQRRPFRIPTGGG
jgi:predicted Zn-dependent protease